MSDNNGGRLPKIFVDCSTIAVEESASIRDRLKQLGSDFVAAPISGNAKVIKAGKLSAVISGAEAACKTVQPLMERAEVLGTTKLRGAQRLWGQVDRKLTDLAVWLPLVNPRRIDLVSARVRDYAWSPGPSGAWIEFPFEGASDESVGDPRRPHRAPRHRDE